MFLKYLFSLLSTCSSMPSHIDVSYDDLFSVLQRYAMCEQRLGKWGSVCREQNRRNWTSERGSIPLSSCLQYKHWSLSASDPLLLFSAQIISALLRQGLPGISVCMCDYTHAFVDVCESPVSNNMQKRTQTLPCKQAGRSRSLVSHVV